MFAVPGTIGSLFLMGERLGFSSHVVSGLALSVLFIGILGVFGRIVHMPFEFIKFTFALAGLVALMPVVIKFPDRKGRLVKPDNLSGKTLFALLLLVAFGITINFLSRTTGDDQSYLAYLTSWRHAQPLNFQEVIFNSGDLDRIRFWFAMFPMSLALLSEISDLHGLLVIGFYLEPFLVAIAIFASYNLYGDMLRSKQQVIAALLLQFTILFLLRGLQQPGLTFFNRMSEDKVFAAFILAPMFFLAARIVLDGLTVRSGLFFLLIGFSLAIMHPVILAYSVFIAGLYMGLVTITRKDYKRFGVVVALLLVVILPSASLRFIDVPSAGRIPYDLEFALEIAGGGYETRIAYLEGTPFYGFNPERIQIQMSNANWEHPLRMLLSWSYLWILGFGFLWSFINLKKDAVAPFTMATILLVLLAFIPYTGWLVGYFVSARMLWRTPWMLPAGLISAILITEAFKLTLRKIPVDVLSKISAERASLAATVVACLFSIGYFSTHAYKAEWQALAGLENYRNTLARLAAVGNYLENNLERPSTFVAPAQASNIIPDLFSQSMMDYLPGLSSKSKVVSFRNYPSPYPVDMDKINLVFSPDETVTIKQRVNILKRHHIQYVLVDNWPLKDYYANHPQFFDIQNVEGYWILNLRETPP
jgi:hypothetical protein